MAASEEQVEDAASEKFGDGVEAASEEQHDEDHAASEKCNVLKVRLVSASGLLVMDKALMVGKGSSDPRVTFKVGDDTATSTIQKKTLEPTWDEEFTFVLLDGPVGTLEVLVEDWDLLSSADFMGSLSLPLPGLLPRQRRSWALVGDGDCGTIELELELTYDPEYDYFADDVDDYPEMPPNLLKMAVTRGRQLLAMDSKTPLGKANSSDPKCRLEIACRTFTTKTIKKSLNPKWFASFECHVEGDHHALKLTVEDVDVLSANDFMGCCHVDLSSLSDKRRHRGWHLLTREDGVEDKPRGEIELLLRWVYEPGLDYFTDDDDRLAEHQEPNELCIAIVQARSLLPMDKTSILSKATTSDPLARISLGGSKEEKTRHVPKSLTPWWAATFRLPISAAEIGKEAGVSLELIVEDYDLLSANDFMGCCNLIIDSSMLDGCRSRQWVDLKQKGVAPLVEEPDKKKKKKKKGFAGRMMGSLVGPKKEVERGCVEVVLQLCRNRSLDRFDPENEARYPGRRPNELRVALLNARDLPAVDANFFAMPSSDPFVTLTINGRSRKSKVKRRSLNPTWNDSFSFFIGGEEESWGVEEAGPSRTILSLLVEDYDDFSAADFMCKCTVPLSGTRRINTLWTPLEGGGEIQLRLQAVFNPSLDFCGDGADTVAAAKCASFASKQPRNLLRVAVLAAHPKAGIATLKCAGLSRETAPGTEWHQSFTLALTSDREEAWLDLELQSLATGLFGKQKLLGSTRLDLRPLINGKRRLGWLELRQQCFLEVAARWDYDPELDHFSEPERFPLRQPNVLQVAVVQARGLKEQCFARVSCGGHVAQTGPAAAWWNERLALPLEQLSTLTLEICRDRPQKQGSKKAIVLGTANLDTSVLLPRDRVQRWLDLAKKAAVECVFRWVYDPEYDFTGGTDIIDGHEPNEIAYSAIVAQHVTAEGAVGGSLAEEWRITLSTTPRPPMSAFNVGQSAPVAPLGGSAYFGERFATAISPVTSLHLAVLLERRSTPGSSSKGKSPTKKKGSYQTIGTARVELKDLLGGRRFVPLEAPKKSAALSKVKQQSGCYQVEIAVHLAFNVARTPHLGEREAEAQIAREAPTMLIFNGRRVVAVEATMMSVPREGEDEVIAQRNHAPSKAPKALFKPGAFLRSFPVASFLPEGRGLVSCDLLASTVGRVLLEAHWQRRSVELLPGVAWTERYAVMRGVRAETMLCLRLDRLDDDSRRKQLGKLADELLILRDLSSRHVFTPKTLWWSQHGSRADATIFFDRPTPVYYGLARYALGGRGPLFRTTENGEWASRDRCTRRLMLILADVASALAHAHGLNIAHNAVGADAVLVSLEPRRAQLSDWGFASRNNSELYEVRGFRHAYRSPEIERAYAGVASGSKGGSTKHTLAETDIWAFACLAVNLFEPRRLKLASKPVVDEQGPLDNLRGEKTGAAFNAYCSKDRRFGSQTQAQSLAWLKARAKRTLEERSTVEQTTTRRAARAVIALKEAEFDGKTWLRLASDPLVLAAKLGSENDSDLEAASVLASKLIDEGCERYPMADDCRAILGECFAEKAARRPRNAQALLTVFISEQEDVPADLEEDRIVLCASLGELLLSLGRVEEASTCIEEAQQKLGVVSRRDSEREFALSAKVLFGVANLRRHQGGHEDDSLTRLLDEARSHYGEGHPIVASLLLASSDDSVEAAEEALAALRAMRQAAGLLNHHLMDVPVLAKAAFAAAADGEAEYAVATLGLAKRTLAAADQKIEAAPLLALLGAPQAREALLPSEEEHHHRGLRRLVQPSMRKLLEEKPQELMLEDEKPQLLLDDDDETLSSSGAEEDLCSSEEEEGEIAFVGPGNSIRQHRGALRRRLAGADHLLETLDYIRPAPELDFLRARCDVKAASLKEDAAHFTHLPGFLLEESNVASLSLLRQQEEEEAEQTPYCPSSLALKMPKLKDSLPQLSM